MADGGVVKVKDLGTMVVTVHIAKQTIWRVRLAMLFIELASWVYPGSMPVIYEEESDG